MAGSAKFEQTTVATVTGKDPSPTATARSTRTSTLRQIEIFIAQQGGLLPRSAYAGIVAGQ